MIGVACGNMMILSWPSKLPTLTPWMEWPIVVKVFSFCVWNKKETHLKNEFKNAALDIFHT